jgi:hypothetical protein
MSATEFLTRKTTLAGAADGSFDREFWSRISPSRRLEMVWGLSLQAWEMAGRLPGASGRPRAVARVHRT